MAVDITYSMYDKKGMFIYNFDSFDKAIDFITKHNVGYKWSYRAMFTQKKYNCVLPQIVYIVKEIDTGGGYNPFGKRYWYNVDKMKGDK